MKMKRVSIFGMLTLVTFKLLGNPEPNPPSERFDLVREGAPACTLVLASKPSPAARLAAQELQYHLLKISGAELPIRTETEQVQGRRLLVGESSATRSMGLRGDDFQSQEYLIAFRTNTLVLIGRDWVDTPENRKMEGRPMVGDTLAAVRHRVDFWKTVNLPQRSQGELELPGLYDDQGTVLATYDFLERFCGVRWYGPGDLNVIIPSRSTVSVQSRDIQRSLALKHRSALPAGTWPFLRGQWGEFTSDQVHLYWRRFRQGGELWAANHTFHSQTIKTIFQDPEYQSKNPRTQGSQLCYTNPKLIHRVAQMARDYFDGKAELPLGWKGAGNYFALVPDDNVNLCNCPSCEALLQHGRGSKTGYFSSGEMSDYWFSFVNAVAREVQQTHTNKFIATLAYWQYAVPPRFDLEPNVSISPCLHTCYYSVHPGMRDNDLSFYEQWRKKTKAPMFLWVYYHHPMEAGLIGKWKCFPNVMVHETSKAMRKFIRDGVRGIFECGEQDQLEQYVISKVWDDPDLDVDAVIDEFFRLSFGNAAEPMKRFYLRLEEIAGDPANYPLPYYRRDGIDWKNVAWEKLGTQERMEELGGLMKQAEKRADTENEKKRVALWNNSLWNWMSAGREEHLADLRQQGR